MPEELSLELLKSLCEEMPAFTPAQAGYVIEAATVCLEHNSHSCRATLKVDCDREVEIPITWNKCGTNLFQAFGDTQEATEYGATCIAILLVAKLLNLVVVGRSAKGSSFDYYLAPRGQHISLFQGTTALEVSGILKGKGKAVEKRVKRKMNQVKDSDYPTFVAVVEFGQPRSVIVAAK